MKKIVNLLVVFGIGSFAYGGVEVAFRGYTHISMFLAGGLIFLVLYSLFNYIGNCSILIKCLLGCVIITTIEFLSGIVLNIIMKLDVWDYSQIPFNIYGQICLVFSIGWFFITIPASFLANGISRQLNVVFKRN